MAVGSFLYITCIDRNINLLNITNIGKDYIFLLTVKYWVASKIFHYLEHLCHQQQNAPAYSWAGNVHPLLLKNKNKSNKRQQYFSAIKVQIKSKYFWLQDIGAWGADITSHLYLMVSGKAVCIIPPASKLVIHAGH